MSADGLRSPAIRKFLDRPRFATIAMIDPDGAPFTAVVWYALEESTDADKIAVEVTNFNKS